MFPKLKRSSDTFKFVFFSDSYGAETDAVNALVKRLKPDYICHGGDYNEGTIRDYAHFIVGPVVKDFLPEISARTIDFSLGNHDIDAGGILIHNEVLRQPGNGRYFKVTQRNVSFFFIDYGCDSAGTVIDPDGNTIYSLQGGWLKEALRTSTSTFNIGVCHRSFLGDTPVHGDYAPLNWPYHSWGMHLLLTGHNHVYEEFNYKGFPIITCGLGGGANYGFLPTPSVYSRYRLSGGLYGAMLFEVDKFNLVGKLYDTTNTIRRIFILNA